MEMDTNDKEQGRDDEEEDVEEIQFSEHTLEDMLYRYPPNKNYNPIEMEEDGHYPEKFQFNWTYQDVPQHTVNTVNTVNATYPQYNGPGLCLKTYVHRKFNTLLGICGTAGSFSYDLLKQITLNSNAYV